MRPLSAPARLALALLTAAGVLLPLLFAPSALLAAPAVSPQSLGVLIVSDGTTHAQRLREEQLIALIKKGLEDQGMSKDLLPILTYHTNKPAERAYLEKSLGVRKTDLVFMGLVQHKDYVVKKVLLRVPRVSDPAESVGVLFERAVAVLSGTSPSGTPTPSPGWTEDPEPTPDEGSSAPASGTRIETAVLCKAVNPSGQPLDSCSEFSVRDTFYVSLEVKGLRYGTVLEARWYGGGQLVNKGRLVSNRVGDYYPWFSMAPTGTWRPGSYRVVLYVDGRQQKTQYFRVNEGD